MNLEQKDYPTARQFATDKYAKLNQPLCIYSGMSRDAFDYIELYILVLSILCIAIAAPVLQMNIKPAVTVFYDAPNMGV